MMEKNLLDCDELFQQYLSPWYPEEERPTMTRPDMYVIAAYNGKPLDIDRIQYLTNKGLTETQKVFAGMREAYKKDFQSLKIFDTFDLEVLDAVDKAYGRQEVMELLDMSDPQDFNNPYLVVVCEFGLALGDLFVNTGKFQWLYAYPYFHSIVVNSETGLAIPIFDWAVKKFSAYGIDDGYQWKFLKVMDVLKEQVAKSKA